jgi:hypothetical protein
LSSIWGTALFSSNGSTLGKFTIVPIRNGNADEQGDYWSVLQNVAMEDLKNTPFPVQLHYYNKDRKSHLSADGQAEVFMPGAEAPVKYTRLAGRLQENEYLIRLRVYQARFFPLAKRGKKSIL